MRRSLLLVALIACAAALAAGAQSALADGDGCPSEQLSQPFVPWGDQDQYTLAPNGDFEAGLAGWSVSGNAGLVAGPEPWMVTDAAESESLDLPAGSSATTAPICLDVDDPSLRFFAVNNGDPGSTLSVSVSFTALLGIQVSLPIGDISSSGAWEPTPTVMIWANLLAALDPGMPVQFSFTPTGSGDWEIDDVYIDPWGRS